MKKCLPHTSQMSLLHCTRAARHTGFGCSTVTSQRGIMREPLAEPFWNRFWDDAYLTEQSGANRNLEMQIATLEVLACIAFRQPISEAEIDPLFDAKSAGSLWRQREASTRSALKT